MISMIINSDDRNFQINYTSKNLRRAIFVYANLSMVYSKTVVKEKHKNRKNDYNSVQP